MSSIDWRTEYLDDIFFHDRQWALLVAVMALRLDWLCHRCLFHLRNGPYWSYLSYQLSRRQQSFFRHLGFPVAGV